MIINHNIAALNASIQLTRNQNATNSSLQKLSSGLRINSAADDAAGLAISEKMKGQINGLDQASRNAQDATSLVQTAEGALNETQSILQRMRELAVQAGNDTNTPQDRGNIQDEINSLTSEVNRIGNTTQFNTQNLLDGSLSGTSGTLTFQIGANSGQTMTLNINDMTASGLGISAVSGTLSGGFTSASGVSNGSNGASVTKALDVSTSANAQKAVTKIQSGLDKVSAERSQLGATINRLSHTVNNLTTSSQNLTDASSRITDVNMASEMANFTKNNILSQAAQAMLYQANQLPQGVLQLLR
jgi:Flagellin and related hook-associated proteins